MVLTSTHNLCLEQKYEKLSKFLSGNFQFLEVKFYIYLNRRVFVMSGKFVRILTLLRHLSENIFFFFFFFFFFFVLFCFCIFC